jgi:hypothetical protein
MSSVCFGLLDKGVERGVFPPLRRKLASTHRKKRLPTFPSPAGMSLTKLSLAGNNLIIPAQEAVSDIPTGDGNVANLFFTVHLVT